MLSLFEFPAYPSNQQLSNKGWSGGVEPYKDQVGNIYIHIYISKKVYTF